ncbi:MAG TPA: inositol monophosphatase family protein [Methylomirabilota bacterium]|jgi:myo-inositol-1(or 4)-monophosphatase|nr:inositol monophosphatase family protein [Methylomirabilota bacterium]
MRGLRPETVVAVRAAQAAGRILMAHLGRVRRVRHKGPADLVTPVDLAAERCIIGLLSARFPALGFLGEEGGRRGPAGDDHWIVDPLDGTTAFVHGLPTFAVCIALARGGRLETGVTLLPRLGELFVAERGRGAFLNGRRIRVSRRARLGDALLILWHDHSVWANRPLRERLASVARRARAVRSEGAGYALACVAAGRADAYWEQSAEPWDMAAGALLVAEAGGRVTDDRGRPLRLAQKTILATNGRLHERLLRRLDPKGRER